MAMNCFRLGYFASSVSVLAFLMGNQYSLKGRPSLVFSSKAFSQSLQHIQLVCVVLITCSILAQWAVHCRSLFWGSASGETKFSNFSRTVDACMRFDNSHQIAIDISSNHLGLKMGSNMCHTFCLLFPLLYYTCTVSY